MTTTVGALKGLRDIPLNAEDWSEDVFAQKMWCLLHMELKVQKSRTQASMMARSPVVSLPPSEQSQHTHTHTHTRLSNTRK